MNDAVEFTVTEEHLKLLRRAYVRWETCEFGAPAIDCKRPYGNSYVLGDIAEILGMPAADDEGEFEEGVEERMRRLHGETETVLQIILCTGEMRTGTYMKESRYAARSWRRLPGGAS